ncbi:MAG: DUF4406 domain-containing protein [Oscillospiraceae bacterium]|jgi:hypothetical protein|nr:DUF4406 domain-containing protein [Oscillospiraceae bacterium]
MLGIIKKWRRNKEPDKEKLVYIASPCRGDVKRNMRKAAKYTMTAIRRGAVPITPHLFYSTVLNDNVPEERDAGMKMGIALLCVCDELWVFGTPTEGMIAEVEEAIKLKIPVIYHSEAGERKDAV